MTKPPPLALTRRGAAAGLAVLVVDLGPRASAQTSAPVPDKASAGSESWTTWTAAPRSLRLRPEPAGETAIWAFDERAAGPVLRVRHGDEVRLRLMNHTERPLSLHWHGVRGPNPMDGVGGLTQEPVGPGQSFDYRFTPPDAGTFLIRPLIIGGGGEPAGRGLGGLLIVDERDPPKVDHEFALVVRDWRLEDDGSLAPFGTALEAATGGRLGNVLNVNANAAPARLEIAPGSRVRLRLANACNARSMRIRFDGLKPYVAAIDGQPTDTFEPLRSTLPFSPGTRYDLLLDVPDEAGQSGTIVGTIGQGLDLVTLTTKGERASAGRQTLGAIAALPANRSLPPSVKLQNAQRRDVVVTGGARRGPDGQPVFDGDPKRIWLVNGAAGIATSPPLLSVKRGSPVVLAVMNQTPVVQPIHLHGHVFRLLHAMDDGWEPYWIDTLQVPEQKTVRIAFVADNPGKWLLGSTVLERFDTGLWTWFEVT